LAIIQHRRRCHDQGGKEVLGVELHLHRAVMPEQADIGGHRRAGDVRHPTPIITAISSASV
jgi:hypothetical protein